jgi:hypothetical protein
MRRSPGVTMLPKTMPRWQAEELISKARALLVVSRFDAFPHLIMEAFEARTPAIAPRICRTPQVVTSDMSYLVAAGAVEGGCIGHAFLSRRGHRSEDAGAPAKPEKVWRCERIAPPVHAKVNEVLGLRDTNSFSESRRGGSVCARP